jgi:outer membrane protein TolC
LGAALGVLGPTVAVGQEVRVPASEVFEPPQDALFIDRLQTSELSLSDAVRLTLLHSPRIQFAGEDYRFALGRLQEAQGRFDHLVSLAPGISYVSSELFPFLKGREIDKRLQLDTVAAEFQKVNAQLNDILNEIGTAAPRCPEGIQFLGTQALFPDLADEQARSQTGVDQDIPGFQLAGADVDLDTVCIPDPRIGGVPVDAFEDMWDAIDDIEDLGLGDIRESFGQVPRESLMQGFEISEAVFRRAQLGLERLGPLPNDEIAKSVFFDAGYLKPFRTGLVFGGDVRLEASQRNFKDKLLDPKYGGFGIPERFTSFASITVDMPLGKGRGTVSAGASERAAEFARLARHEQLRHVVSEEVFRTVLSYFNLVAAQDTLGLLEESLERQEEIAELLDQLLGAGQTTIVEVGRANARVASVTSSVINAQLSVLSARLSLAQAIGLELDRLSAAPLALETFGEGVESLVRPSVGVDEAVGERRDVQALQYLGEASREFSEAANADLKRRVDLSGTIGLSPLYESPFHRFLPDEDNPIISDFEVFEVSDSPIHYYSPRGFARAFDGEWQPFGMVSLRFELPFGNNRAKGQALQARASLNRSEIEATNLERVIRDSVVQVSRALQNAARTVEERDLGVGLYSQTLDTALDLFEAGELTLIDILTTEEDLTLERLGLVQGIQVFLSTLTRLSFEENQLVRFEGEGTDTEMVAFESFGVMPR